MVFSSVTFLYVFLPILLIVYFATPKRGKNLCLLIASLAFYFYGEPRFLWLILLSCIINYIVGKYIFRTDDKKKRKVLLILGLIVDFGLLFYFKYFNFFLDNIENIFGINIFWTNIALPLGISFYTFQSSSYIVDIYNGKVDPAPNFVHFATYLTLFPQLIAGPIVRYEDVSKSIKSRTITLDSFASGVEKFIIGLSKKVLLANTMGKFASILLGLNPTVFAYFLIGLAQTLQIYLDFSGYSDMAIGLGKLFGFSFPENFDYPFISKSVTEFWRRWHKTLSSWLRDYIYIPLGGNRVGRMRRYLNILIVWMFTGLWHGAGWNFVLWGLFFAVFLVLEKSFLLSKLEDHPIIGHIYTLIVVYMSFIIFNTANIGEMTNFIKNLFGVGGLAFTNLEVNFYFKNYSFILIMSILASTPILNFATGKLKKSKNVSVFLDVLEVGMLLILLLVSTSYIISDSFNPFLYFRF